MDSTELLLAQGYHKMNVDVAVGGYEEVPQLDPDLMHIRFIMCHAIQNANGDTFTNDVLKQAQHTPRNKPVNWEHGQPFVGTILASEYKEDSQGVGFIEATGVIWKFIYPELSSQIKAKASTGELRLSMECYYKDSNYQVGDQIFDQETAEKMGIIPYVGREYMGKRVARVFKEVIFGGVGVVASPADKRAVFLSVAKDLNNHGITDGEVDEEAIVNMSKTIADAIQRTVNDFNKKTTNQADSNAVTVAKYVKAFDKAKSSIVAKFNKEQITSKDQMITEVRNSISTLMSEISSINTSYYRGVASEEAMIEDKIQEALTSALNFELAEAYFRTVEEDYITYDVIDYSLSHPDSKKTYKTSFSNIDDSLIIDLENASEIILEEGDNNQMSKETIVATEQETEVVVASEEVVAETVEEVAVATEEVVEEVVEQASASELEATIASLQSELATEKAEKQALASKIAEFESRFAELESEKVLASRLSELKDAGIEFTGSRLEKETARIKAMSSEDFADHKELLVEVAGKKVETVVASEVVEEEEEILEATASDEAVEEDIVVEGAKANAGLVIEQVLPTDYNPFAHLTRK